VKIVDPKSSFSKNLGSSRESQPLANGGEMGPRSAQAMKAPMKAPRNCARI
jgi:hypothetical protein